jgi:hypothetical protein
MTFYIVIFYCIDIFQFLVILQWLNYMYLLAIRTYYKLIYQVLHFHYIGFYILIILFEIFIYRLNVIYSFGMFL